MTARKIWQRQGQRALALAQHYERPAHGLLLVGVIALLVYDLHLAGWRQILVNLPGNPWFYLIFVINYNSLPLFEVQIYSLLWRTGWRALPILIKKRVYNEAVIDYSGETALFVWARTHTARDTNHILADIRDVSVLSALTANIMTFAIIAYVIFWQADKIGLHDAQFLRNGALLTGGSVVVLAALIVVFRKWLLGLPTGKCLAVAGLHGARILTFLALQSLQWHVAVPTIGWMVWLTFLALQMAVSRLPALPAKDLLFTGLAISLGIRMAIPSGQIGGLFLASTALNFAGHAVMYCIAHVVGVKAVSPLPTKDVAQAAE
jgi:hypothetical protein